MKGSSEGISDNQAGGLSSRQIHWEVSVGVGGGGRRYQRLPCHVPSMGTSGHVNVLSGGYLHELPNPPANTQEDI